jgi:hypothetical protein
VISAAAAGAANQHQLNAVHIFFGINRPGSFEGEELGQRQAQKTECASVQKISARYTKSRRATPSQK